MDIDLKRQKRLWIGTIIGFMVALDLENAETPNEAFIRKLRPEVLLGLFFKNFGGGLYG